MNTLYRFLPLLLITGCGGDLNSQDGPSSGKVSGVICAELPLLSATQEPAVRQALLQDGSCTKIPVYQPERVEVIRTVTMPADGKYSQFLIDGEKMWVKTSLIRP